MGTSTTVASDWMLKNGTDTTTIYRGAAGWYKKYPNGQIELIHSINTGASTEPPVIPTQKEIKNPSGTLDSSVPDILEFTVVFDEYVKVTGTPRIQVTIDTTDVYAEYDSSVSSGQEMVFRYTTEPATTGDVTDVGGAVKEIDLNGGTIKSISGKDANVDFPTGYVVPTVTIS